MRKQEMSPRQLQERTLIVESLLAAGWKAPSNENEMFDEGLWVLREAVMHYNGPEVSLNVFYRSDEGVIYLEFEMPDESMIELKMDVKARLRELLGIITSFQDKLTQVNYKEHIRSLMAVCENIYVMTEGENFIRLTENKR